MTLPASRSTTYLPTVPPAIKAQDLNDMQDAIVAAYVRGQRTDFGPGSDGDQVLDGTTWPSWAASGIMSRDALCNNLTISAPSLQTRGFRIYCRDTLQITNAATVISTTTNTSAQFDTNTGQPGYAAQTVSGMVAGANGSVNAPGSAGAAQPNSFGGSGGAGGAGETNAGGAGGAASVPTAARGSVLFFNGATFGALVGGGQIALVNGGGAGGSGGALINGSGTNAPGFGGGAGGGVIAIVARNIILAAAGNLRARGGSGTTYSSVGLLNSIGGGGGGGGGVILLAYQTLTLQSGAFSGASNCPGGAGGGAAFIGSPGAAGQVGSVILIQL